MYVAIANRQVATDTPRPDSTPGARAELVFPARGEEVFPAAAEGCQQVSGADCGKVFGPDTCAVLWQCRETAWFQAVRGTRKYGACGVPLTGQRATECISADKGAQWGLTGAYGAGWL